MIKNKFYIYRHIRLDINTPFYIGKGFGRQAFVKTGRNEYWNRIVNKYNYKIEIIIDNLTENEAWDKEKLFIKLYKTFNLCEANITLGGEGASGLSVSIDTRNKLSKALKGKNVGKIHSIESCKNMSIGSQNQVPSNKGTKYSSEIKENMSIGHGGRQFNIYKAICSEKPIPKLGKSGTYSKGELIDSFISQKEVANKYKVNQSDISLCLNNEGKSIKGYIFEYVKEVPNDKKES